LATEVGLGLLYDNSTNALAYCEVIFDKTGKGIDFKYIDTNIAYENVTGLKRENVIGKKASELYAKEDFDDIKKFIEVPKTGKSIIVETHSTALDRYFEEYIFPIGKNKFAIIFNNISSRKHAEKRLEEIKESYKLSIEAGKTNVWDYDPKTDSIKRNHYDTNILGIKAKEIPTNVAEWEKYVHPEDREKVRNMLIDAFTGRVDSFEGLFRMKGKHKKIVWILSRGNVFRGQNGEVYRVVGTDTDITLLKEAELKAEEKTTELLRLNQELDNFIQTLSHDLRSPLSSAMALADLLKRDPDSEDRIEFVDLLSKSLTKMDKLITDINNIIYNDKFELNVVNIDIAKMVESIFSSYKFLNESGKILELKLKVDPNFTFYSDSIRLSIILNNLISNAIAYHDYKNKKPFVHVSAKSFANHVKITVSDNGRGIKADDIEKIFQRFYRGNSSVPGTGIGLYLVNETLLKLGGEINVKSTEGKGSSFEVKIPNVDTRHNN
jgi:PAS domain S-box-containing protein